MDTTSDRSMYRFRATVTSFILLIPLSFTACVSATNSVHDSYHENLAIRPLVDGKLLAQFEFKTTYRNDIKSLKWEDKFELFPISIADLIALTDAEELHFSLTKGNWNYRNWGYLINARPPGAQIRVKLSKHCEDARRSWKRLTNSLAGKFCSSLEAANDEILVTSKLTFRDINSTDHFLYVNLPEETLCTENLTPWKKLLPCYLNSGLASLLNPVNLFKSSFTSLAIDLEPVSCDRATKTECKQMWSLAKIFGNSLHKTCPVASQSLIFVDVTDLDNKSKLYPQTYQEKKLDINMDGKVLDQRTLALYDLRVLLGNSTSPLNIGVKQNQIFKRPSASSRPELPVHLSTHIAGVGSDGGTIVATIKSRLDEQIRITYMDVLPHFMRIYLHTLTIRTSHGQDLKPDEINFQLSKGTSPTLIEFSIVIPAKTETQISYGFDRAFLRWTEFKPDANKGVLLGSAMIRIPQSCCLKSLIVPTSHIGSNSSLMQSHPDLTNGFINIYARPLLVILPTPDFSMPYNVICLVSTVLVCAFGPIHNMTARKPLIAKKKNPDDHVDESKKTN